MFFWALVVMVMLSWLLVALLVWAAIYHLAICLLLIALYFAVRWLRHRSRTLAEPRQ